jgi:hypothetical protein
MTSTISNTVPPSTDDEVPLTLDITSQLPNFRAITGNTCEYIRPYNGSNHEG